MQKLLARTMSKSSSNNRKHLSSGAGGNSNNSRFSKTSSGVEPSLRQKKSSKSPFAAAVEHLQVDKATSLEQAQ